MSTEASERGALLALMLEGGVRNYELGKLLEEHNSFEAAWATLANRSRTRGARRRELMLKRIAGAEARVLTIFDADYPERLRDLRDPPYVIFTAGDLALLQRPCIAVVGARICSRYGARMSQQLAAALAAAGVCVVSGLARGIDSIAHRAALDVGGATCAVLGNGIDVVYPASHTTLQRSIAARGVIITESLPGDHARHFTFPLRNRLIAALSSATIVVEAGRKSGALGTAAHADTLGRTVAAVPGPITAQTAVGSNNLLRDGVLPITSVDDALTLAGVSAPPIIREHRDLTVAELAVLRVLGDRLLTTEQIVDAAGLPVADCISAIGVLELEGMIECSLTGELRRRPGFAREFALTAQ